MFNVHWPKIEMALHARFESIDTGTSRHMKGYFEPKIYAFLLTVDGVCANTHEVK